MNEAAFVFLCAFVVACFAASMHAIDRSREAMEGEIDRLRAELNAGSHSV